MSACEVNLAQVWGAEMLMGAGVVRIGVELTCVEIGGLPVVSRGVVRSRMESYGLKRIGLGSPYLK